MRPRALVLEGARVEVDGAAVEPPHPRGAWIWEAGALDPAAGLTLWPVPRRRPDGTARPPVVLPLARAVELRLVELEAPPAAPEPEPEPAPPPAPAAPSTAPAPAPAQPEPQGLAVVWFAGVNPEPAGGGALSWPRLRARLTAFPELAAGLEKLGAPCWAPFAWAPGAAHRRKAENVGALSCLVLDCDKLPPGGLADLEAAAEGLGRAACWHTSWSHTDAAPKARLVLPLATPCPVAQWPRVWGAGLRWAAAAGLEADTACRDAARLYVLPGLPVDAEPARWEAVAAGMVEGPPLDWRWFAAAWPAPPPAAPATPPPRERTRTAGEWAERERRRVAGWFRYRVARLAVMPPGGQSMACYGNGRKIAQAVGAGHLSAAEGDDWCRAVVAAGVAAGLGEARAWDSVRRGYAKGAAEVWSFNPADPEPA